MLTPLASHLLFPCAIRAKVHNPSSVAGEQLVTLSLLHPRTEGAHHVPNIITPSHSFCLSSSLPLLLPRTVSPLCFSLPLGRVSHFLPCAKDNVLSSTPITFQPIPGSLYLISGYTCTSSFFRIRIFCSCVVSPVFYSLHHLYSQFLDKSKTKTTNPQFMS